MGNPTPHHVWNDFPTVFQTLTRFRMKLFVVREIGENSIRCGRMGPSRRDSWRLGKALGRSRTYLVYRSENRME
jgi:hypothetical protein